MLLVGIDAATEPKRTGYACGHLRDGVVEIDRSGLLESPRCRDAVAEVIVPALRAANRALIAIDAPLGWPSDMGEALSRQSAGELIHTDPQKLFRRDTDRFIEDVYKKRPLEVGANLIARAAHAALRLLDKLRKATGKPIPLAWTAEFYGIAAIEVYPAATLIAWGCDSGGYKKDENALLRKRIAERVKDDVVGVHKFVNSPIDAFDACLCLLAAKDFIEGKAAAPRDHQLATKEGWIWVRRPR